MPGAADRISRTARRLALTVVLCALLVLPLSPATPSRAKDLSGLGASLYMLEPAYGRTLLQLDGMSLKTVGGVAFGPFSLNSPATLPDLVFSPDATKVAYQVNSCPGCVGFVRRYTTIRVFSLDGLPVARFHPRVPLALAGVSDDGKYVTGPNLRDYRTPQTGWYTLDTARGRVVARVPVDACCDPSLYDAAGGRVYLISSVGQSLILTAYDTRSGTQVGRATLDGVYTQPRATASGPGQLPIVHIQAVATALSSDGKRIAVLDGDHGRLTLMDAGSLRVIGVQTLTEPHGLIERFLELAALAPETAYAKGIAEGTSLSARFSRDGRSLYVTGTGYDIDASGQNVSTLLGLQRLDVGTGEMQAEALAGDSILWLGEGANRSALYVLTPAEAGLDTSCPCVLERLDPVTLEVTAQRRFDTMPQLYVLGGQGS